jgi:hypothetical protein
MREEMVYKVRTKYVPMQHWHKKNSVWRSYFMTTDLLQSSLVNLIMSEIRYLHTVNISLHQEDDGCIMGLGN